MLLLLKNFKKNKLHSLLYITIFFTIIYSHLDIDEFNHSHQIGQGHSKYSIFNLFHKLYFSLITTSTIGFGDITPISVRSRIIVCLHILSILYITFN